MYFVINSIAACAFSVIMEGSTIDSNPTTGLFGFMHWNNFVVNVLILGGFNTALGCYGWIIAT